MKKKTALILAILLGLVILLTPIPAGSRNGVPRTYTSLIYKIIIRNNADGKREAEFYLFPAPPSK